MKALSLTIPVLTTLRGICIEYNNTYCYPSQLKLIERLKGLCGETKSRATINRWLAKLEEVQFIRRQRRIRRDKKLGLVFQSTLYFIQVDGYRFLSRLGLNVGLELKRAIQERQRLANVVNKRIKGFRPLGAIIGSLNLFGTKKKIDTKELKESPK